VTPISTPRFSKTNTSSTSGSADSSQVRSTQTSTTVRSRSGASRLKAPSWSGVKQTTSHRPSPGRRSDQGVCGSGSRAGVVDSDGNRLVNTTTS